MNCVNVCSIHIHHVHSLLLGACSSLPEPRNSIFGPFWRPLRLRTLASRLVRLMVAPALPITNLKRHFCLWRNHKNAHNRRK